MTPTVWFPAIIFLSVIGGVLLGQWSVWRWVRKQFQIPKEVAVSDWIREMRQERFKNWLRGS